MLLGIDGGLFYKRCCFQCPIIQNISWHVPPSSSVLCHHWPYLASQKIESSSSLLDCPDLLDCNANPSDASAFKSLESLTPQVINISVHRRLLYIEYLTWVYPCCPFNVFSHVSIQISVLQPMTSKFQKQDANSNCSKLLNASVCKS